MRYSYSALETYEKCPLKFKFRYLEKLPAEKIANPERDLGISLHDTLKEFYDLLGKDKPSLDLLLSIYGEHWLAESFKDKEEETLYYQYGQQILKKYFAQNQRIFYPPLTTERAFQLQLDGLTIVGRIDRVDRLKDGSLELIDYKTGKYVITQAEADQNRQFSIYHLGVEQLYGQAPEKLTFYFLRPNFKISTTRNQQEISLAKAEILGIADQIKAEKFKPKYSRLCDWCEYQYVCLGQKDKFREKGKVDPLTGVKIDSVIDEYARLKNENKENDKKLEGLKEILHNYCEKHGVERVYSKLNVIRRQKLARTNLDKEKVKSILEPLGKMDEVLTKSESFALYVQKLKTPEGSHETD